MPYKAYLCSWRGSRSSVHVYPAIRPRSGGSHEVKNNYWHYIGNYHELYDDRAGTGRRIEPANQADIQSASANSGKILPAGTYWFVLADNVADHDIVEIFNEDRTTEYATLFTVPSGRSNPADDTLLTFAQTSPIGRRLLSTGRTPER